eukprot:CAMPEP_0196585772 /NCGR_PEP_ID=MMETSP1081-20130531/51936_1 /TAXON_ID=36882 /ORGANISM="Pyramimonas amylifera, Strain CCMP720" /LENGTH=310 /DNA_ID=CAMNT_0041907431 /DNA_START=188 /DNA_END=1116 /DNA_ORIENTATION=+
MADILGKNAKRNLLAIELQAHKGPAYTLSFIEKCGEHVLLSGGDDGRVFGFNWSSLLETLLEAEPGDELSVLPCLKLKCSQAKRAHGGLDPLPEVNSVTSLLSGEIIAGCGDGIVRVWDTTTGAPVLELKGHNDLVHCVVARSQAQQVLSGSEDGTMRIWDLRAGGSCTSALDVWNASPLQPGSSSPASSPWVGCLALDPAEHWVAAGCGARSIALYSLTAAQITACIPTSAPPQALVLHKDRLMSVGAEPYLTQWNIQGKLIKLTDCTPDSAFGLAVHPCGLTVVGGSTGGSVDVISEIGSTIAVLHCR